MPGMQFIIKILRLWVIFLLPCALKGQSVYLPQGSRHTELLDRLTIKMQRNPLLNVATAKPFSRKFAVEATTPLAYRLLNRAGAPGEATDSAVIDDAERVTGLPGYPGIAGSSGIAEPANSAGSSFAESSGIALSPVDEYNLLSLLMNNSEWVKGDKSLFESRRPLWNTFYRTKANFFEVNEKDFFLALNPVLQLQQSVESNNSERVFLNTRGLSLRGLIAGRVGFYTYVAENLERAPRFVQQWESKFRSVPGAGRYNDYKNTGWDFSDARGGITFNAARYIDFQFAYDRNFIGNGYRSLFLSDFGNNYLFLKVNTRIWKLNYQNIFMELNPQFPAAVRNSDQLLDKKYAAIHHLSVNVTPWLNLGLFEAVVFGRKNDFDFMYLNPIIFLRTAEKQNNSPDNGLVGFDAKANIGRRAQLYGQLLFDELKIKELTSGNGWFGNKFGVQLGAKYIDLFRVNNLDIQAELNLVRPFMYSHYDSSASYTHYNQPLAHPLGANFIEAIGLIKYQPLPRLTATAKLILWKQGVDTANSNFGGNIFRLYTTRQGDYGYTLPTGVSATGANAQLSLSYELKQNLFIDASVMARKLNTADDLFPQEKTTVFTAGIRLNMFRRAFDF